MRTADVVAGMEQVRDLLRSWGFTVEEVPGWRGRGRGTFRALIGQADHHDAFPLYDRRGNFLGHASGLRTCTFGRSDLRNSLCMFYLASDGVVYLVAAKPSWHTGRAAWRGRAWTNSRVSGIEARNNGLGELWPDVQLDAYAALNAATCIVFGFDEREIADHKEIAIPAGRKPDRALINPAAWRQRVRQLLTAPPVTSQPEDDHMIYHRSDPRGTDEPRQYVRSFQFGLNRFFTDTGGQPSVGWLVKDGVAGDQTFAATWEAVLRLSAPEPGWARTAQFDFRGNGITGPDVLLREGIDPVLVAAIVGAAAIR